MRRRPLILVVNDDGIRSPGLRAAAAASAPLGQLIVVAPARQQTSMGHAFPRHPANGAIAVTTIDIDDATVDAYTVEGSPALTVCHAVLELAPRLPDLCVSGINYGENLGTSLTASGTLGAAFQAGAFGIPSVAVSVEYDPALQHSDTFAGIDLGPARRFTHRIVAHVLANGLPDPVTLLNVNIPARSSAQTPIRTTVQSRQPYYRACKPGERDLTRPTTLEFCIDVDFATLEADSDIHAVKVDRAVSVTPLSWSMTARADLAL